MSKSDEPSNVSTSMDPADRSLLAEKTFEFKSEDDTSDEEVPVRKTPSVKIKLKKQTTNDADATVTPPAKRRNVRNSAAPSEANTVFAQTANGSSVSFQQRAENETTTVNGSSPGKKRGRPRLSKPSVISANGDIEPSSSTSVTTKSTTPKAKPNITKPQAFMNTVSEEKISSYS